MTLEEAIKINQHFVDGGKDLNPIKFLEAQKLDIEASKALEHIRNTDSAYMTLVLPGETKE